MVTYTGKVEPRGRKCLVTITVNTKTLFVQHLNPLLHAIHSWESKNIFENGNGFEQEKQGELRWETESKQCKDISLKACWWETPDTISS